MVGTAEGEEHVVDPQTVPEDSLVLGMTRQSEGGDKGPQCA